MVLNNIFNISCVYSVSQNRCHVVNRDACRQVWGSVLRSLWQGKLVPKSKVIFLPLSSHASMVFLWSYHMTIICSQRRLADLQEQDLFVFPGTFPACSTSTFHILQRLLIRIAFTCTGSRVQVLRHCWLCH